MKMIESISIPSAASSISVIIPVYNGERYIAEAIRSVLAQEPPGLPIELIVIDDGSSDNSASAAAQFPQVRLFRKEHSGLAATLNAGIGRSEGSLLAFLDADDRWLPGKLARQRAALQHDPALDMIFGHVQQFAMAESGAGIQVPAYAQPGVCLSAALIRRSSFMQVGLFSEAPEVHQFVDWYARASESGLRSLMLPDVVSERRLHDQNVGRRLPVQQRQRYFQALRATVVRRKGAGESPDECLDE